MSAPPFGQKAGDAVIGRFLRALLTVNPGYFGAVGKAVADAGGIVILNGIYKRKLTPEEVADLYASSL